MTVNDREEQVSSGESGVGEPVGIAEAAADVIGSLARLGLALTRLPLALLPPEQRDEARQAMGDIAQAASHFPRTMSNVLSDFAREMEHESTRGNRQDLGSRLRREAREARREARRQARRAQAAARENADREAIEEIEDNLQDAVE